ncbi:bifunctional DNA primase/polymerase [Streptomyces sp. NPDC048639]|uniref:bifunctional DNA primase/polymerase n=1 Tax=Streptomyces sp. NPDC048639 TaxID=3365581 RepID=UPI0037161E74
MPQTDTSGQLKAALDAAAHGWHVFPLIPGDKRPAVRDWQTRATTDPDRITRCWTHAPYNIGVATGPSGLVVVDLDTPKDTNDTPPANWAADGVTSGEDVLAVLCERHSQPYPHDTNTVRTGRGGAHLYFTAPEGEKLRNTAAKLGWKVDTRAHGGYVVAAGSTVAGRPYTALYDAPVAPLPDWLCTLLRPAPLPPQMPVTIPLTAHDRRTAYLRTAVKAEVTRVKRSAPDEHNNALYLASVALGQLVAGGELSEAEVTAWLTEAAAQVGQKPREIPRTIASGLRAGAKRARKVAV